LFLPEGFELADETIDDFESALPEFFGFEVYAEVGHELLGCFASASLENVDVFIGEFGASNLGFFVESEGEEFAEGVRIDIERYGEEVTDIEPPDFVLFAEFDAVSEHCLEFLLPVILEVFGAEFAFVTSVVVASLFESEHCGLSVDAGKNSFDFIGIEGEGILGGCVFDEVFEDKDFGED